jgi:CheY-like chemotaxis protein
VSVILIADDNPHAHRMGKQILSQEGFDVVTASDGNEAMSYLAENRPDLVMADTHMPGPSGFDICRHVKSAESLKGVRVVLLAGPLEPFDPAQAESVRSDAVLHKPLDAYTLIETVKSLIGAGVHDEDPPASSPETIGDPAIVEPGIAVVETGQDSSLDIADPDGSPPATELVEAEPGEVIDAGEVIEAPAEESAADVVVETVASDDPLADLVDIALGNGKTTAAGTNRQQVQQAVKEVLEEALPALVETIADRVLERLEKPAA